MKKLVFLLTLTCLFFSACNSKTGKRASQAPTVGVDFMDSKLLGTVLERAEAENKLVFVDFYTTWCLPCQLMDEDVFPNKDIGDFMNENFISYKVNAEKGNGVNLRDLYQVQVYPTLLFLDTNGRVLVRKEGAAYHTELRNLGEQALAGL